MTPNSFDRGNDSCMVEYGRSDRFRSKGRSFSRIRAS